MIMESYPKDVWGAMQIPTHNPREGVSCELQLILFWDVRRMKAGILKISVHADKLVPLPVTAAMRLFIIL